MLYTVLVFCHILVFSV